VPNTLSKRRKSAGFTGGAGTLRDRKKGREGNALGGKEEVYHQRSMKEWLSVCAVFQFGCKGRREAGRKKTARSGKEKRFHASVVMTPRGRRRGFSRGKGVA